MMSATRPSNFTCSVSPRRPIGVGAALAGTAVRPVTAWWSPSKFGNSYTELLPGVVAAAGSTPVMFDSGVRDATDAVIALARGATAVGIGRPYAYALSYGGTESLTHFLKSFLAELDLCMAICGFKDIASLKDAGGEPAMDLQK